MHEDAITRLSRVLAVLAVITGVIAMHGLASHHGATVAPVVSGVLATVEGDGHTHAAAVPQTGVDAHGCDLLCQGGDHALALLCSAVLLATGGAVLVLRQRTGLLPRRTGPPAMRVTRATTLPRSFDLVADLCISRT
jgi:hypothetical protein